MRFKKKDLKKVEIDKISELVDADGSPIEGDDVDNYDSQIKTAPNQTTDDYEDSGIQPNDYYYNAAYMMGGTKVRESIANQKMKNIIEDLVTKNKRTSIVQKEVENKLGGLDTLDVITGTKIKSLLESIDNLDGENLAVVLNIFVENIDLNKIPSSLLKIIKNKL